MKWMGTASAPILLALSLAACGSDAESTGADQEAKGTPEERALAYLTKEQAEDGDEVVGGTLTAKGDGSFEGQVQIKDAESGVVEDWRCSVTPPADEETFGGGYSCGTI
ncbi:hypothetical protein [Parerythrobacter lacustris]|uniref:Lipoprotein n=1 Tax=Parerythrobacter lacustris TaxID=2969984 RepID=A0ABT1XSJ8_9SPHN|nr:hypothetical protein [Parerythrobacter lacustris]MCR2834643.1 hypothetical protein [Parerythrobacter lacustris]